MTDPRREHRLRPRKEPRQQRAVETRARILAAAREVFEAEGYDGGTTNHIAEAASMSVGSLYQYFPNKDAILVDLMAQHIGEGNARITGVLTDAVGADGSLRSLARGALTALLSLHREESVLHHVLMTRTPVTPDLGAELAEAQQDAIDNLAALFDAHPDVAVADTKVAAKLVASTVNALVHAQVGALDPPLDDEALVDEATDMLVAYLGRGAPES